MVWFLGNVSNREYCVLNIRRESTLNAMLELRKLRQQTALVACYIKLLISHYDCL